MKLQLVKFTIATVLLGVIGYLAAVRYNAAQRKAQPAKTPDWALLGWSEQLLLLVKTEQDTRAVEAQLANFPAADLAAALPNDQAKKVFWINLYNAWYQLLYTREGKRDPEIFTDRAIGVAHCAFSLDDIEHGILRKYRWKYSLGYLENIFASSQIKALAVDTVDFRLHFALNCGAKSCPVIAFYQYQRLEPQLDNATRTFLLAETELDTVNRTVVTSKILSWFRADFGGAQGTKQLIGQVFGLEVSSYSLSFRAYNWDADLRNFAAQETKGLGATPESE